MSKLEIEIPDDRWFRGEWEIRPHNKQLCVVILKRDDRIKKNLLIMQWVASDTKESGGCFVEISANKTDKCKRYYVGMYFVDRWKPLGLPADVNERVLAEVEKWFEEKE